MDYSYLLTSEIEAEMPANMTSSDQFRWRQNKANELAALSKIAKNNNSSANAESAQSLSSGTAEQSIPQTTSDVSQQSQDFEESASNNKQDVSEPKLLVSESTTSANDTVTNKQKAHNMVSASTKQQQDFEFVKNIPKSVMSALRRVFPDASNKGDLISAFVYVYTGGDCEISPTAMKLVESFETDDKLVAVTERLANIERIVHKQSRLLQSIELCTCYDVFDRRYGSKERRVSPRDTEFREQGNLDMLARLRQQADDQKNTDDINNGRQIYNQVKNKGD